MSFDLFRRLSSLNRLHATALAVAIFLPWYSFQCRLGFSLWDEGFLWYGVQRVLQGEVPIRDFMAYDFGRYYWSAMTMNVLGDHGILALRHAGALFQGCGLVAAVLLIARSTSERNLPWATLSIVTLILWMYPRHKLFDITLSILVIGIVTLLIEKPSVFRLFSAGVAVGLIAVFGRNHGLYGFLGSIGGIAYLRFRQHNIPLIKAFAAWALGSVVGYLPMLMALTVVPRLKQAFWEGIRFLLDNRATNLPLPVPWPWRVQFDVLYNLEAMRQVLIGLFFIALPGFAMITLALAVRDSRTMEKTPPVLVASSIVALPYAHFAFSRADLSHLAQGIFPFLIGALSFAGIVGRSSRFLIAGVLVLSSLIVMGPVQPAWTAWRDGSWRERGIGGDKLLASPDTAAELDLLEILAERYAPGDRPFIAAPFWPGAYAVHGRRSPMWEVYALFPRSSDFQLEEIERIRKANPGFAIILDHPLDGRDELRFRNTHPLIDQYLRDHFDVVSDLKVPEMFRIYRDRQDHR